MDDGYTVLFSHRIKGTARAYLPYPTQMPGCRRLPRSIPPPSFPAKSRRRPRLRPRAGRRAPAPCAGL